MVHPKKQPRRCRRFIVFFGQNWDNVVNAGRFPVLKVLNFFSQIFIISYMRLKLRSLSLLDPKNMPKPIPHCSNFRKIIFLKNGPSYILSTTGPMDNGHFLATVQWSWSWAFTLTLLSMWRGVREHHNEEQVGPFSGV